eukprot:TRINITY_DN2534_c0_g1_i1.p1 TRINITY_DN2534_c0_g1~~TRINITY_DN2534_c0_g1_i1.p1  ORF type:complete len:620 (+),score=101.73 TRINITY_DN2534_c0_g1_i1:99-1958(+)
MESSQGKGGDTADGEYKKKGSISFAKNSGVPSPKPFRGLLDLIGSDHAVICPERPPMEPDIVSYLGEAVLGMRFGLGDHSYQARLRRPDSASTNVSDFRSPDTAIPSHTGGLSSPPSPAGSSPAKKAVPVGEDYVAAVARRIGELTGGLFQEDKDAVKVATSLFWISFVDVFHPDDSHSVGIETYRDHLCKDWHALNLYLRQTHALKEDRDWMLECLPFVYAQAFYRVLVDNFEEDRKHFIENADQCLDKLTLVVHFELAGFQMNPDTVRKARKKLFLKYILIHPHTNARDFLQSQKLTLELESKKAQEANKRLAFGDIDGSALEERQLKDVLWARSQPPSDSAVGLRTPASKVAAGNKAAGGRPSSPSGGEKKRTMTVGEEDLWDLPRRPKFEAPNELTVDNYSDLSGVGADLLRRHMGEMNRAMAHVKKIGRQPSGSLQGSKEETAGGKKQPTAAAAAGGGGRLDFQEQQQRQREWCEQLQWLCDRRQQLRLRCRRRRWPRSSWRAHHCCCQTRRRQCLAPREAATCGARPCSSRTQRRLSRGDSIPALGFSAGIASSGGHGLPPKTPLCCARPDLSRRDSPCSCGSGGPRALWRAIWSSHDLPRHGRGFLPQGGAG